LFNVYSFGSTNKPLFPVSVVYDDKNLHKARVEISGYKADMGGTEILSAL